MRGHKKRPTPKSKILVRKNSKLRLPTLYAELGSKLINLHGLLVKCEIPAASIADLANFIAVPDPQRYTSET